MSHEKPNCPLGPVRDASVRHSWPIDALAVFALSLLVTACDNASTQRNDEIKGRLVGAWLQESVFDDWKIRSVVTFQKDGTFQQAVKAFAADGSVRGETTAGEWFFDGETLKRRYRTVNGKPVSGIQFASYQFVSLSDTELACVDHLTEGKREVRFRRVPEGTAP